MLVDAEDLHPVEAVGVFERRRLCMGRERIVGGVPGRPQGGCYPDARRGTIAGAGWSVSAVPSRTPRRIPSSAARPAAISTTVLAVGRGAPTRPGRRRETLTTLPERDRYTTSIVCLMPMQCTQLHRVIHSAPSMPSVPSSPLLRSRRVRAVHTGRCVGCPSTTSRGNAEGGSEDHSGAVRETPGVPEIAEVVMERG